MDNMPYVLRAVVSLRKEIRPEVTIDYLERMPSDGYEIEFTLDDKDRWSAVMSQFWDQVFVAGSDGVSNRIMEIRFNPEMRIHSEKT